MVVIDEERRDKHGMRHDCARSSSCCAGARSLRGRAKPIVRPDVRAEHSLLALADGKSGGGLYVQAGIAAGSALRVRAHSGEVLANKLSRDQERL